MSPRPQPPVPVPVSSSLSKAASSTQLYPIQQQSNNDLHKQSTTQNSGTSSNIQHVHYLTSASSSANNSTSKKEFSSNFWENYEHLCALQNLMPLQCLKNTLSIDGGAILNLNADKLKSTDWDPLLGTLRVNKGLKTISIISNYSTTNENDSSESRGLMKGFAKLKKTPSIRNKERVNKLCRSLKDCLTISPNLSQLELYNIVVSSKDLSHVAKGLRVNKTIKILSLDRCMIGDEGLAVICKDIQSSNSLNRVNFSSCNLTHKGAEILANLIKVQALKRHNEAWKDSLRYGRPDLDSMFGIRRITINSNPLIGDDGVFFLAEAFKSDLWLKALDLQNCGITTKGANYLLDGLKFNAMMHVLDVRLNVDIDRDTLQKIMEQVMINSSGHTTEYEWMDLSQAAALSMASTSKSRDFSTAAGGIASNTTNSASSGVISSLNSNSNQAVQHHQQQQQQQQHHHHQQHLISKKLKKRRNTNASFSKKTQFISATNSVKMKRCKSTGSVMLNKSPNMKQDDKNHLGVPWRAAARANRYRISSNCAYRKVIASSSFKSTDEIDDNGCNENDDDKYEDLVDDLGRNYDEQQQSVDEDENENLTNQIELIESTDRLHRLNRNVAPLPPQPSSKETLRLVNRDDLNEFQNYKYHTSSSSNNSNNNNKHLMMASSTFDYDKFQSNKLQSKQPPPTSHQHQQKKLNNENLSKNEFVSNLDKIRNVSVKDLLVILQQEQESKTQLEDMLIQLQEENTKLKAQISLLRSKCDKQQEEIQMISNSSKRGNSLNRTVLYDDKALEIIELTLYKYQNFLDFLRNAGFGKLIDIGEMNQQQQQQLEQQQQQQQQQNSKNSKKSSKQQQQQQQRQTFSPSTSKLNEQQKYYLEKMKKVKNKIIKNSLESTKVSSSQMPTSSSRSRLFDENSIIDRSLFLNGAEDVQNQSIETLVYNARELSRSMRLQNSSSVNNSLMAYPSSSSSSNHINNHRRPNDIVLSDIIETNKENAASSNQTSIIESSLLIGFDESHQNAQGLIDEYLNAKKKNELNAQPKAKSRSQQKSNSKSPESINSDNQASKHSSSNNNNNTKQQLGSNNNSNNNSQHSHNENKHQPNSTASTSPATTVIVNSQSNSKPNIQSYHQQQQQQQHQQQQQQPVAVSRTSVSRTSKNDENDLSETSQEKNNELFSKPPKSSNNFDMNNKKYSQFNNGGGEFFQKRNIKNEEPEEEEEEEEDEDDENHDDDQDEVDQDEDGVEDYDSENDNNQDSEHN